MKAPQPRVAYRHRDRPAGAQVLRITGVVGSRERHAAGTTVATHRESQRSFGGDVDGVRPEGPQLPRHVRARRKRQSDLRITRTGDSGQALRRDDAHFVPEPGERRGGGFQGGDDAVGLRCPGIGCERNPHAASATGLAAGRNGAICTAGQRRSCSCPRESSISALHDSTQSPLLQ